MTQINRLFDDIVQSMKTSKDQTGKIDVDLHTFSAFKKSAAPFPTLHHPLIHLLSLQKNKDKPTYFFIKWSFNVNLKYNRVDIYKDSLYCINIF